MYKVILSRAASQSETGQACPGDPQLKVHKHSVPLGTRSDLAEQMEIIAIQSKFQRFHEVLYLTTIKPR